MAKIDRYTLAADVFFIKGLRKTKKTNMLLGIPTVKVTPHSV